MSNDQIWTSPDGNWQYDYTTKTWSHLEPVTTMGSTTPTPGGQQPTQTVEGWVKKDHPPDGMTAPDLTWSKDKADRPPTVAPPSGPGGPPPPKVPGGDGKGNTSVHTPSLDLVAANIKALVEPVTVAASALKVISPVQPGAFYQADAIRSSISGDNGDGGLQDKYHHALLDLANGLTGVHDAILTLSKQYKNTEDANKGKADDVTKAFGSAKGYFTSTLNDAGGSGGSGPSSG